MQVSCVSLHFLVATWKKEKETGAINLKNRFYLTQTIKNIVISPCNQYKNDEWDRLLFLYCFEFQWVFYTFSTFHCGLATYQVLSDHKGRVVPTLVTVVLELHSKYGLDQQHRPHLGAWQRCRILGLTPDLLSQNLHFYPIPRTASPECTLKFERRHTDIQTISQYGMTSCHLRLFNQAERVVDTNNLFWRWGPPPSLFQIHWAWCLGSGVDDWWGNPWFDRYLDLFNSTPFTPLQ